MKLILKRIDRQLDVTAIGDDAPRYLPGYQTEAGPFALHTEAGEILPCQVRTTMTSPNGWEPVELTVVFRVDGKQVAVAGDEKA